MNPCSSISLGANSLTGAHLHVGERTIQHRLRHSFDLARSVPNARRFLGTPLNMRRSDRKYRAGASFEQNTKKQNKSGTPPASQN